jgi:hypothetical protein
MQWSAEELNAMTLQVGLIGIDGIVIASDMLLKQKEDGGTSRGKVSKFLKDIPGLVCCHSGDTVAETAANNIRRHWRDKPPTKQVIKDALEGAGDQAWKEHYKLAKQRGQPLDLGVTRKVIAACHDELWELEVGLPRSLAHRRPDRVIAGDAGNTARHFNNKYAEGCEALPVARLITLAAYTVLIGGQENPEGIAWLEVVVVPKGGAPISLTPENEEELKRRSDRLSATIKEQLLQPFDY